METNIDFVVTWVDPTDPKWIKEYNKYSSVPIDENNVRFRDFDLIKYVFRSIEKFAPWVRKVHFITFGHIPKWMNINHEKINVVKHTDYIPAEFLPTFNSNAIEMNLHRLKDLSENFVLFNDDMLFLKRTTPDYFFYNNFPCDSAILDLFVPTYDCISNICFNNINLINKYFKMNNIKENLKNWITPVYGHLLIKNLMLISLKKISSFEENHIPHSFKKSILKEIWDKEEEMLNKVSTNKFRSKEDVNQWLIRYWQFCENKFYPRKAERHAYRQLDYDINETCEIIEKQKVTLLCINDSDVLDFDERVSLLLDSLNKILGEKSTFEK